MAVWAAVVVAGGAAGAQERSFLGVPVKPLAADYIVPKDVNLRAKPLTDSPKIGNLAAGTRVKAVGEASGDWLAVTQDGRELGFVYAPLMLPVIDGALASDLSGAAVAPGGARCDYTIHFEGKSAIPDEVFETADYDIAWHCEYLGKKIEFSSFMFITEAPYESSQDQVYQISIDVREVGDGFENILSTVLMYQRKKNRVVLDSVSLKEFSAAAAPKEWPARSVEEALAAAVALALGAWNNNVWRTLSGARR